MDWGLMYLKSSGDGRSTQTTSGLTLWKNVSWFYQVCWHFSITKDHQNTFTNCNDTSKHSRYCKNYLRCSVNQLKVRYEIFCKKKFLCFFSNPKDACVSFFHMDKLLDQHGLPQDFDFDKYVNDIFMKGKPLCGSFWEHLNVSLCC